MEATMMSFSARRAANFDAKTVFAAAFLKFAALVSAIGTLALAALVLSWQAGSWILTGERTSFPISRALALAGLDEPPAMRATADALSDTHRTFGWFLDLPASGFLLAVAAVLIGFWVFAASVEKQFAPTKR
jgi:hypothetical protein